MRSAWSGAAGVETSEANSRGPIASKRTLTPGENACWPAPDST